MPYPDACRNIKISLLKWWKHVVKIHSLKKETPRMFNLKFKKMGSNFFWPV